MSRRLTSGCTRRPPPTGAPRPDAAGLVSDEKAGVAACLGATWVGEGVVATPPLHHRLPTDAEQFPELHQCQPKAGPSLNGASWSIPRFSVHGAGIVV